MLQQEKLFGEDVLIDPHISLNSCKGVIRSYESPKCTDVELKEWFESHNICSFYRIPKKPDAESECLVLTFMGKKLPEIATVGFERCRVRQYIPNPTRCFRCQRYGHVGKFCNRQEACAKCGSPEHVHTRDVPCNRNPLCVNCGKSHASFDRSCPRFKIEKEAQRLRTTQNITRAQALRLAEQSAGGTVSYASTAALPQSGGTTDETLTPLRTAPKVPPQDRPTLDYSLADGPRASPHSTPKKRLQLEPGAIFSKYKKFKMPSTEDLSSDLADESLTSSTERIAMNNNSASANTDDDVDPLNPPEEEEAENGKAKREPKIFTNEELLNKFLKCHIDILPETQQRLVKSYLKTTCDLLMSNGMNRSVLNLERRSKMNLNDVPKEVYKKKTDVLAALKSRQFSEDEYGMLCLLCIHEFYTVAIGMAKKLKDKSQVK